MSYDETIRYLYGLQSHGIKLGLDNPRALLKRFGDPQGSFRSIHVAGTNGKGSTAAALASMLSRSGTKTGLFTSPHLVSFTERIRVDGVEITEREVVSSADEIRTTSSGLEPTFFEVVTVMGVLHFKRSAVRWAVVETGLGGRLDAKNVLAPEVTIITPIDMDHQEFLGESLPEVAAEKAGIIKPGVPLVSAPQKPEAMEVIRERAREAGSSLFVEGEDFGFAVKEEERGGVVFDYTSGSLSLEDVAFSLAGAHQAMNAALAIRALELAIGEGGHQERSIRACLASLRWPGRLELLRESPPVYIDGAHNPSAARALARTLRGVLLKDGRRLSLVIGVMSDKNVRNILSPLLPLASSVIFAAPRYGRAAAPEALSREAASLGFVSRTAPSVASALETAIASGDAVLVTGSFYTIGEAKEALGEKGVLTDLREWQAQG
jgi:dihydrofolate synthase/folylpolyglutamate synthase